jgi:hypothetical protein
VAERGGLVTLEYFAAPGETNTVTVTQNVGSYTVSDATAPVAVGADCTAAAGEATCADPSTLGPIQAIFVSLGNLDDQVDVNASIPSTLFGRAGADILTGGDGPDFIEGDGTLDPSSADTINIRGPGPDSARCDDNDSVLADFDDNVSGPCAPVAAITSGPAEFTNDTSPSFAFAATRHTENFTGFECMVDPIDDGPFPCNSPFQETTELPDGPYHFRVRAVGDGTGPGLWAQHPFNVDTQAPQVNVAGPVTSTTSQPTFELSANEATSFECALDQGQLAACGSPFTTPALANGSYVLHVRGTDRAGNQTTTEFPFTVQAAPGAGGGTTNPPAVQPRRIIIDSLVLISGRPVKMSRNGEVSIRLQCAGSKTCKGRMSITTAEPVKRKSRKLETLGSKKFTIAANKKKNVKMRFSKSKRKLAKRLKRFKAKVVIREIDQRGNARISSRVFILRAR